MDKKNELVVINYDNIPAYYGAKEKQELLLSENPFIDISDSKSYQEAKKHRTALRTGRTELQNGEKTIASKLKEFRDTVKTKTLELIGVTKDAEDKQQAEITRYENEKQAEKEAAEKAEKERIENLRIRLNSVCSDKSKSIDSSSILTIEAVINDIQSIDNDFEDLGNDFILKQSDLISEARRKKIQLEEAERLRIEKEAQKEARENLEKEKALFEKEKKELAVKKELEEKERQKEELIKKQNESANLAIQQLNIYDVAVINMVESEQEKDISGSIEKIIQGDFGKKNDEVAKVYKIVKEKLTKKKADLLDKEEKEKEEKQKEVEARLKLGLSRQTELKSIGVAKTISECLLLSESAYFELCSSETKVFNESIRAEEIKEARNNQMKPYIVFIRNYAEMIMLEESVYQKELLDVKQAAKIQWDIEEEEEKAEKEAKELEEKRQAELMKSDTDKLKDLISEIEELKRKYTFTSKKYVDIFAIVSDEFDNLVDLLSE